MRNVAFSILLGALALMQIAVVVTELSPSRVPATAVAQGEVDAGQVVAFIEEQRKVSTL